MGISRLGVRPIFHGLFTAAAAALALAVPAARGAAPAVLGDLAQYFEPEKPYRAEAGADRLAVALGLFPPLQLGGDGTDVSFLRLGLVSRHHNVSGADLSLLCGRARAAFSGVQLSVLNVVEGPVHGVQVGVLANVAGTIPESGSAGAQLALVANWADAFDGIQFAFGFNRDGAGGFAQVAAICNSFEDFGGVQVAAVNLRGKTFRGVQFGALNGGADSFSGLQIGLLANSAVPLGSVEHHARMSGWQVSPLVNAADEIDGGQASLVNLAADVRGVQIGLYNQARRLHGVQIGLLNHCDASDIPFLPLCRASF